MLFHESPKSLYIHFCNIASGPRNKDISIHFLLDNSDRLGARSFLVSVDAAIWGLDVTLKKKVHSEFQILEDKLFVFFWN